MNEDYFLNDRLPGFWLKSIRNIITPLFLGVAFVGIGAYTRIIDNSDESKLFSFSLLCLILGSSFVALAICWIVFEHRDRQSLIVRNRTREQYTNRAFVLNLRSGSIQSDNEIYSNYYNITRDAQWTYRNPPPSYQQATNDSSVSFIPLTYDYSTKCIEDNTETNSDLIKYLSSNENKDEKQSESIVIQHEMRELSVINLQSNLCLPPCYEDAVKLSESDEI